MEDSRTPASYDCPFCGKKQAIKPTIIPSETTTTNFSEQKTLGGYSMKPERIEFDFSHAFECPQLQDVTEKVFLLEYKMGRMRMLLSDGGDYFQYEALLKGIGIIIRNENVHTSSEHGKPVWEVKITILSAYSSVQIDAVQCRTMDAAFAEMKHILLCGLILKVGNERWQFMSSSNSKLPAIRKL